MGKKEIIKGYLKFSFGTWVTFIVSLLTVPVVTRLISPEEFGKANTLTMLQNLLTVLCMFGTGTAILRFYYDEKNKNELLWSIIIVPLGLWAIATTILLALSNSISIFISGESSLSVVVILSALTLTSILNNVNISVLRVENKSFYFSAVQIIGSISSFVFTLLIAVVFGRTYWSLIISALLSAIISFVIGLPFSTNLWLRPKLNFQTTKSVLYFSFPLLFAQLLWDATTFTDRFMLRIFTNFQDIGIYSAAYKLINITRLVTTGFSAFWAPYAFRIYTENPENVSRVFKKSFDYTTYGMVLLSIILVTFKDIVFLLLGEEYRAAALVAPFLLLHPTTTMIAEIGCKCIEIQKKTYWFVISDLSAFLFNIFGNLLLIPKLGAVGAAISTGLSMIVMNSIKNFAAEKVMPIGYDFKRSYFSLLLLIIVLIVNSFYKLNFITIVVGLFAFLIVTYLYREITSELASIMHTAIRTKLNVTRKKLS